jgi:phage terminase large subunit GpA-like protein
MLHTAVRTAWAPRPHLRVSQIAERDLVLSREYSKEPGPIRLARTPFLGEPMDRLSPDDPVQTVVFLGPVQAGKTIILQAFVASVVGYYPGPMLIVTDTDTKAEEFAKYRLDMMVRDSPHLRSRMRDNTIKLKTFPGGYLKLVGAQSGSGLTSMTCRYVAIDEADDHKANVSYAGSSVSLAIGRMTTYGETRKGLIVSSPKVKGESEIEAWYDRGDRRRYWVPCPRCGEFQVLRWRDPETGAYRLVWPKGHPEEARYLCAICGAAWEDRDKNLILPAGEWRAERPDLGEGGTITSYAVNALYSPVGFYSWTDMARQWEKANERVKAGDIEELRAFVNTRLAESFEEPGEQIDPNALANRLDPNWDAIPAGVRCIVIGGDVQDDRIEAVTLGIGSGWELYVLAYNVILSDPLDQATWASLDALVLRRWTTEDGRTLRAAATCVDSGHRTQAVYDYARTRKRWGVRAIKGVGGPGRPIWDKAIRKGGKVKYQGQFYAVGTDTAKDKLHECLKVTEPGPKFLHVPARIPSTFPDWFEQLTAERKVHYREKGKEVRGWRPITEGRRNEVLDTMVYVNAHQKLRKSVPAGRGSSFTTCRPSGSVCC